MTSRCAGDAAQAGRRTLILGGARSGKSARALALAQASGRPVTVVVTARSDPADAEWQARIARHRRERPAHWHTVEAPLALPDVLRAQAREHLVLVDCLTLWLSNVLLAGHDPEQEGKRLLDALVAGPEQVILVSNEVGLGVVPEHALGRAFRDAQGWLNQQVAARVDRVELVVAGIPLCIKDEEVGR